MRQFLWLLFLFTSATFAAEVPDLSKTPGVSNPVLSVKEICSTKWGKDHRFVTAGMKAQVFSLYGLSGNNDPSCKPLKNGRHFEIDHLISRELGGADDAKNLWPQCYSGLWGASVKDKLENRLHQELCLGNLTLTEAQNMLVNDWRIAYRKYYGEPK